MNAAYVLSIHLIGGQTIVMPVKTYNIVPPGVTHDDQDNHVETPMYLEYTPVNEEKQTLGFLNFNTVQAIEVERSPETIAAAQQDDG